MPEARPPAIAATPVAIDSGAACTRPDWAVAHLRSTKTVRSRAAALLARARRGESKWFTVHDGAMTNASVVVAEVTRARYPKLTIPYHSRWRHFEAGGVNRAAQLTRRLEDLDAPAQARARIDLALVSVLLDAGAGPDWGYTEAAQNGQLAQRLTRSEGLGVASFHAFMAGLFSSDPARPLQADARGLQAVTAERLRPAFQVSPKNPLVGLEGRAALLQRLGQALLDQPAIFSAAPGKPRPGQLFDHLAQGRSRVTAHEILSLLLTSLAPIWPAQNSLAGVALGDCWHHPAVRSAAGEDELTDGWMPFHKLSQWLTYSLIEPFEWAGVRVDGLDELTGLPEYRNGGLFLDAGVLNLRDAALAAQPHEVGDELVVEWRALTVALLDELAPRVRQQLGLTAGQMPLACVLEGGTWAAGRVLAQRLRGGLPPLTIRSDGTVF
jgi:Protein of unknown function (DUF1688)